MSKPSISGCNEEWMKGFAPDTPLSRMILPASHDSGMSICKHNTVGVSSEKVITQYFSVADQIRCGCRYFDIRVDYDHNELVTYHRTDAGVGANGEKLEDIFNGTVDFLAKHESEFVIFKISHLRESKEAGILIDFLSKRAYSEHYFKGSESKSSYNSNYLTQVKYKDLKGKILILLDSKDFEKLNSSYISPKDGRWGVAAENGGYENSYQLNIYDKYSNTKQYDAMKKDQIEKWNNWFNNDMHPISDDENNELQMFLLSWTLTSLDIAGNVSKANDKLCSDFLEFELGTAGDRTLKCPPNFIYLDFIDESLCSSIIRYNFNTLKPKYVVGIRHEGSSPSIQESGSDKKGSSYMCPEGRVIYRRTHKDDENGTTKYYYGVPYLIKLPEKESDTITMEAIALSSETEKHNFGDESSSSWNPSGFDVMVGRDHGDSAKADEHGKSVIYTKKLIFKDKTPEIKTASITFKESKSFYVYYTADMADYQIITGDETFYLPIAGRKHSGDENGVTETLFGFYYIV